MLSADPDLQRGHGLPAPLDADPYQLPHASLIQHCERVVGQQLLLQVERQELADVVAAVAVGQLSQVVGAEREELGVLRDPVRDQRGPRHLDHGADRVAHVPAGLRHHLAGNPVRHLAGQLHLRHRAGERDHDLGLHREPLSRHLAGRLHDGPHLHVVDLGEGDAEAAAPVPEHRVRLLERLEPRLQRAQLRVPLRVEAARVEPRVLLEHLLVLGEELVQRRIEQPDGDRVRGHGAEDADEVLALERQQAVHRLLPVLDVLGHDHVAHDRDALVAEEHVLGAHQPDALRPELPGLGRVRGSVGVGAHPGRGAIPRPSQERLELARERRIHERLRADDHLAGGAVQRDDLALAHHRAPGPEEMILLVDDHVARAHHAALAPAAGDHRRVRRQAAARGQHALGRVHAGHVLGRRLGPHEDDLLLAQGHLDRLLGIEHHLADRGRGGGGQALGDRGVLGLRVDGLDQQLVERGRLHPQERGVAVDALLLAGHLHRDAHRGRAGPLAGARLQDVEPAVLHRELDVLHVAVVGFQAVLDRRELGVDRGHLLLEGADRLRGADPRDHVLALGVDQELAEEAPLPARGVPREADPGARGGAEVAEHHRHHGHRGAPVVGEPVDAAVVDRLLGPPGVEHRVDGQAELLEGILRERPPGLLLHHRLQLGDEGAERVGGQVGVGARLRARLGRVQQRVEGVPVDGQHHVREQGDEAAVAVPGEAVVPGPLRQPLDRLVVQTQVEDGVHHAGHGRPRSGAHRDEERARRIAEAAPCGGLEPGQVGEDLLPQAGRMLLAGRVVGRPGLGGDGEAGRHRYPELRHLGQLAPLATQQRPQGARSVRLAVRERVDVLGSASGSGSGSPAGGLSTSGHQRPPQQSRAVAEKETQARTEACVSPLC